MTAKCSSVLLLGTLLTLLGCRDGLGSDSSADDSRFAGQSFDKVVVIEGRGNDFLSYPLPFTRDPVSGDFFIPDLYQTTVFRVTTSGQIVGRYGRRGTGPGEYATPFPVSVIGDTLLVTNRGRGSIELFDLASTAFLATVPVAGLIATFADGPDDKLVGYLNTEVGKAWSFWRGGGDTTSLISPIPQSYQDSRALAATFPSTTAIMVGDNLLVGFQALPFVQIVSLDGEVLQTLEVPATRRRVYEGDLVRAMEEAKSGDERVMMTSALMDISRATDGRIGLVHFDAELRGETNYRAANAYLTRLTTDGTPECVDLPLFRGEGGMPHVLFVADTLYALHYNVDDDDQAEFWIGSYQWPDLPCVE